MYKTFRFTYNGKQRSGIIGASSRKGKQSKEAFTAFYHADIIFNIDGDGSVYLKKNRFPNKTINLSIENDYVYIEDSIINFPNIRVYNDNGLKTDVLLKDPISIDLE